MGRARRDMKLLLNEIVFLEGADARHVGMNAERYIAAARSVRRIVERDLGRLSMHDFVSDSLPALQTTAENIFFDGHRHFADLDGSGNAERAQDIADHLLGRLRYGLKRV